MSDDFDVPGARQTQELYMPVPGATPDFDIPKPPAPSADFELQVEEAIQNAPNPPRTRALLEEVSAIHELTGWQWDHSLQVAKNLSNTNIVRVKRLGKAIVDRFKSEQITVQLGQLGTSAMKAFESGDLPKYYQYQAEYKSLRSTLPQYEDVAPAYSDNILGKLRGFGRKILTGSAGLIGLQTEMLAGKRATEGYYDATKDGPLSATYLRWAARQALQPVIGIGEIEMGSAFMDMVEAGVDPRIAAPFAKGIAAINNMIEFAQYATFVKMFPGADKVISKITSGFIGRVLAGPMMKNTALRLTLKLGETVAEEFGQEVLQEVTTFFGENFAIARNNAVRGTDLEKNKDFAERLDALFNDFLPGIIGLALIPTVGQIGVSVVETARASQARVAAERERIAAEKQAVQAKEEVAPEEGPRITEIVPEVPPVEKPAPITPTREEAIKRFEAKRGVEFQPLGEEAVEKKESDNILHPEKQKVVPVSAKEIKKQLETSYEKVKDVFFKRRDKRIVLEIPNLKKRLQTEIKTKLHHEKYSQAVKDVDAAIQIHIDTKRNPADVDRYYELLTEEQRKTVDLSQNLPAEMEGVIDKINEAYKAIGLESKEADVIHNTLENYTARIWDRKGDEAAAIYRKFGTTSRHAKARVFDTILEGWALGYELKVKSATNNLAILQEEMVKTIENKKFLKAMSRTKGIDGSPLITTKNLEGYKEIKHPNFVTWRYAGKADPNEVYGKNFFVTDKGTLLEKSRMYAPEKIAKNLNNIFGTSALKDIPVLKTITKYNAIIKSWILQSSFFHHLAFSRSYFLGVGRKKFKDLSIRQAYREGLKAVENMQEEIVLGVENGLTLGLKQDWDESLLQEKTIIENFLAKNKVSKAIADKVNDLRQKHVDFLFGGLGAGLKAKSFLIEFQHEMKRTPNADPNVVAKRVANLINDDFGGLHLERMGRNPTVQHIFRIFALAPDWTESNVRSMVKAFKVGDKAERQMYQRFWTRVLVRGAALTVMANFLMAGGDPEEVIENYKRAWRTGSLRWMDVDVTSLYQLFGGETGRRKYFSIFGHFKDPVKFIFHPIRSAHYKGSVMYGIFHEAIGGADWAGRKFTTLGELLQTAETVKWGPGRPLSYEQLPSYFLSQLKGIQPVQIQNLISWMMGEMEGFDAIANSLGLGVRTTYP